MAIAVFVALWLTFIIGMALRQQYLIVRSQRQGLLRASARFGGRLESVSWFESPSIRMWKGNFEANVRFIGSGPSGQTQFRIPWIDPQLTCSVRRRQVIDRLVFTRQEQPIDLAAPLLDDGYVVIGNDESRIRRLLSARVQTTLIHLLAMPVAFYLDRPDVQLSISDGLFVVTKSSRITESYALEAFIYMCAELHDAALVAAGPRGVDVTGASESKPCA